MNTKKLGYSLIFILVTIFNVFLFWQQTFVLTILLILTAIIKHKLIPIKKEALFYITTGLIGPVGESIVMFNGPWAYSTNQLINFPFWLPFLWGLAGTVGASIYEGLTSKNN